MGFLDYFFFHFIVVVVRNGLLLPVVDSPEQENRPPIHDMSMEDLSSASSHTKTLSTDIHSNFQPTKRPFKIDNDENGDSDDDGRIKIITTPGGDLPTSGEGIVDLRKTIEEQEDEEGNSGGDRTTEGSDEAIGAAIGSRESGKRTKFTLRRSIMERFQRCGIDFKTFAPP